MASSPIPSSSSNSSLISSSTSATPSHYWPRRSSPSASHRRLRRLFFAISVLLLSPPPIHRHSKISSSFSALSFADAFSCISPYPSAVSQTGKSMTLGWTFNALDSYFYDTVSALVYCMDSSGPDFNVWRQVSILFINNWAVYPVGQYTFKQPNCGPRASSSAVRLVAQGWSGSFIEEAACIFGFEPMNISPLVPLPETTSFSNIAPTQSFSPKTGSIPTTTAVPPPTVTSSTDSTATSSQPLSTASPIDPSQKTSLSTEAPTSGTSNSGSNPTGAIAPSISTLPPLPPLPNLPNPGSPPIGPSSETHNTSAALRATLLSVGIFVGLAAIVVPLLVMRRRRRRKKRQLTTSSSENLNGPTGRIMKETKRRLGRQPKKGYFYKMDDEEDDYSNDGDLKNSGDLEKRHAATASKDGNESTEIQNRSLNVGAGIGELDMVTVPQMALISETARGSYQKRRSSYTMSSYTGDGESSFGDDSSVVRKYWAASMAAREERRLEDQSSSRGLGNMSGYDEGSIFGDQSRDSDSRMADILSNGTMGSMDGTTGDSMDTSRHYLYEQQNRQYRRDTLNTTFDDISTRTQTPSLSSAPDSCLLSEEEFLERMHFQQLQAQLQHEYYYQQQRGQIYYDSEESMLSRRTSSVPSLTSTNDPFKTFDSNEIVVDQPLDPFADPVDSRQCIPSPEPSSHVPTGIDTSSERSYSDLVQAFPPVSRTP
ncbi:hypothetical protein FBU30_003283 [Linnemannia zychae]|nr:hypothetical protein FBU30_003283 [Linnemannia zychae]